MYPQALTRLGLFLIEHHKKPGQPDKAIVIGIRNSEKKKYLVAGISGHERPFAEEGWNDNEFGILFQQAVEAVGAETTYNGFETSTIEIDEENYHNFLDEMTKVGV